MAFRTVTSRWEYSHGKKPRGEGNWGIGVGSRDTKDVVWHQGTLTQALEKAKSAAKERGLHKQAGSVDLHVMESSEMTGIELTELSRAVLGSYIKKAAKNGMDRSNAAGEYVGAFGTYSKGTKTNLRKANNRVKGINRATDQLTKEGTTVDLSTIKKYIREQHGLEPREELAELSKKTLGSYIEKGSASAGQAGYDLGHAKASRDETDRFLNRHMSYADKDKVHAMTGTPSIRQTNALQSKIAKRLWGIKKATARLTKESVEMTKPVAALVDKPYEDSHSLHDKAMHHRMAATQAEHRYFTDGPNLLDKSLFHANMAKYHDLMQRHSAHNKDERAQNSHISSMHKHMGKLKNLEL